MGTRLNRLRDQSTALRHGSTPCPPATTCLRRSPRHALHSGLLAPFFQRLLANAIKLWRSVRRLSGDDGYERYLAHHRAAHPDTVPLSRRAWFVRQQQRKWSGIKRCC